MPFMPTQEETAVQPLNKDSSFDNKSSIVRRARIKTAIGDAVLGIVLFGAAGDLVWLQGWAYMAVLLASTILSLFGPFQIDAGLMQERMSKKPDAKQWDWFFVALVGILTFAELIVPAFDHRWGWTHQLRPWMSWLGLAMVALGTLILIWSMRVNRFFSAVIRIQSDRGHYVISTGPYRIVRHPGYAGWGVRTLGVPLLLGSVWAFIPASLFVASFVIRTILEDRVLQAELPGYSEYESIVRAKLLPGIW